MTQASRLRRRQFSERRNRLLRIASCLHVDFQMYEDICRDQWVKQCLECRKVWTIDKKAAILDRAATWKEQPTLGPPTENYPLHCPKLWTPIPEQKYRVFRYEPTIPQPIADHHYGAAFHKSRGKTWDELLRQT